MREQEPLRARRLERLDGLVEREVTARLAVELAAEERRLAHEEVGIAGGLDELARGRRVARVGEHVAVRLDAERVRLEPVVRDAGRRDGELADRERRVGLVLRESNVRSNMSGKPSRSPSAAGTPRPPAAPTARASAAGRSTAR